METGKGKPMLARIEINRQSPLDTQKRYFHLGRGRQVRMSCLHVEHDLGHVNVRLAYSLPPTAAQKALCDDPTNTDCHGNCVWTMDTFKSAVQPRDCTRATCTCRALGDTNGDGKVMLGRTEDSNDKTELVHSRLFQFTPDESATAGAPGHFMWNNQGITNADPVIYKAHGGHEVDFYVQYWTDKQAARQTTPGVHWGLVSASLSFTARVEDPTDYFCFTKDDTRMPYSHRDPVEDPFLDDTPNKDDAETEIPRHAGFQYMVDRPRVISSASGNDSFYLGVNYRYWDLGTGPQVDVNCVNVWATTTDVPYSSTAACTNSQYGWDQMGWNNKVALLGNLSNQQAANLTVDVLDVFDCNAYTMWTDDKYANVKYHNNPTNITDPYYTRNLCCYQTNARTCAGQRFGHDVGHGWDDWDERVGQPACFWNPQNEMCYPLDTLAIRSLKETVGSKETYTLQSGHVHLPRSSYVVQRGELMGGHTGNTMRRWFLRVGNHMRMNEWSMRDKVTCPLSVLVSYKSNTHGGTCEPSGRNMCDRQADECTKKYGWAVRNAFQFWKMGDDQGAAVFENNEKRYNGCNCLKEKEICYRNVGCTSTKKYQLILQNCYDQQCGDYCNSAGSARAALFMVVSAVAAALFA